MYPEINSRFPMFDVQQVVSGTIAYPPGGHFGPRIQQDWQLFLLDSGSARLWVDEEFYSIEPGSVTLLKPGHWEKFEFSPNEETWHRWIVVKTTGMQRDSEEQFRRLPYSIPISKEMNQIANFTIQLKYRTTSENEALLRSLGATALHLYAAEASAKERGAAENPYVFMAKGFVSRNYRNAIGLPEMARAANVTEEHLIRLFKRYVNMTPMHYLWQYRVNQGVDLLSHTGLTVMEIAYRCGFKTSYHFARTIKKWTGKTPTEIRKGQWGVR